MCEKKMEMEFIENENFIAKFRNVGAELASFKDKFTGIEYIFPVIPEFWSKSSPVLFPLVGCAKDNRFLYNGKTYDMHIHGFANYQEFQVVEKRERYINYELKSEGKYTEQYPFEFILNIIYQLDDNKLKVIWKVTNVNESVMYFSIGGHPAFSCPIDDNPRKDYFIQFKDVDVLDRSVLDMSCGLLYDKHEKLELPLKDSEGGCGVISIEDDMFDRDAIICENYQTSKILLLKPDKTPYLSVNFETPVFGVWSPSGAKAPFVCIEPWYGRCDKKSFHGEISDREWINVLQPGETFHGGYEIEILK
ncbi:MAG: aldose 1-epimerase family protein [Clostridiales bacterium]|nr:aldose 1-epimerase family protein [Clostridiales bacterium]